MNLQTATQTSAQATLSDKIKSWFELSKPEITLLVFISTFFGFYAGAVKSGAEIPGYGLSFFLCLILGSILSSAGVSALNQIIEVDMDALMDRTKNRPIPSGRLSRKDGLIFGLFFTGAGTLLLGFGVHPIPGILSLITVLLYLFVYTPLKQKTPLNTLVGAIPGALPPLGGWIAATGHFSREAWILFGVLFAWQIPHFLSIAWIYRKDYKKAGFQMYCGENKKGVFRFHIIAFSLLMVYFSLLPSLMGFAGRLYLFGAVFMGLLFFMAGMGLAIDQNGKTAKIMLKTSVYYLPLLLLLYALDTGVPGIVG